jgi:hypothetical protein
MGMSMGKGRGKSQQEPLELKIKVYLIVSLRRLFVLSKTCNEVVWERGGMLLVW